MTPRPRRRRAPWLAALAAFTVAGAGLPALGQLADLRHAGSVFVNENLIFPAARVSSAEIVAVTPDVRTAFLTDSLDTQLGLTDIRDPGHPAPSARPTCPTRTRPASPSTGDGPSSR
jgi:hypothetical protein